jgi:hypothetical protein
VHALWALACLAFDIAATRLRARRVHYYRAVARDSVNLWCQLMELV